MNFTEYVEQVDSHFERLGVDDRPNRQAYIAAWNNQIPARKMAETYARRLHSTREEATEPSEA